MTRAIDILLCVALLVGAVALIRAQSKLKPLQTECDRLVAKYGEVKNPRKLYLKRIPTGNEKDFLWKIYLPPGVKLTHQLGLSSGAKISGTRQSTSDGRDMLYRINIVCTPSNIQFRRSDSDSHGSMIGTGSKLDSEQVIKHWPEMEISTASDGEYNLDELMQLLTVEVPPSVAAKIPLVKGGNGSIGSAKPIFLKYELGTQNAYMKAGL